CVVARTPTQPSLIAGEGWVGAAGKRAKTSGWPWSTRPSGTGPASQAVAADDLAHVPRRDGAPGIAVDALLDEPHRAVEERHVHAARVVRAGADDAIDIRNGRPAEEAGLPVRRHDVRVAAPLPAVVVGPLPPLVVVVRVERGRGLALRDEVRVEVLVRVVPR